MECHLELYQLIQGYDFYHLHKEYNCLLQMGGSDQWKYNRN
jgi:tyrosyl-tRNA synthetase